MNDRSLESLQKNENCLWARWSCLWRPDVTLEFLNQLEKDLEVIVLQLSVRLQSVCVCTVLNLAQANRGVASQPTSQTTPPAEAPLPESQSPPAPVIDQQTPRAAAASPFSNLQTSGPPDLPPPSTLRHRNIATNQSISTYVNPTPKHHPRNHGSVTTHPYTRLSFRKRTPPAAEYEWTPDIQLIYARYFAERGEPEAVNLLRLPPVTVPQHRNIAPIVERTDLEILAQQLNEYLETHPVEPIIGSIDNPFPLADKYGIKGLSVLSALIHYLDEGIFTCRFCHHTDTAIDHALLHQRAMRHYSYWAGE